MTVLAPRSRSLFPVNPTRWQAQVRPRSRRSLQPTSTSREELVMEARSHISVIDDDESVRESLPDLLREFGFVTEAFASAADFLASDSLERTECLILDVAMPGMSGPELHRELLRRRHHVPVVYITARADATVRPRLLAE